MMSWSSSCFSFFLRMLRSLTAEAGVCTDAVGPEGVLQDTGGRRAALFDLQMFQKNASGLFQLLKFSNCSSKN